jgi:predicted nuclease of restriction endonuclease-like (RecB) superfamily
MNQKDRKLKQDIVSKSDIYPGYDAFLQEVKARIQTAQLRAAVAVHRELVLFYWSLGRDILARQQEQGWGAKVIDRLSADLRREFPTVEGFSPRNLKYMRAFAQAWPDEAIVQQAVAQIPWGHNVRLLDKVKDQEQRLWYVQAIQEYGWSRDVLEHQIETKLYERQGKAITNFERTLPSPQSDLAQQTLKDPYAFDFLLLHKEARESELQDALVTHIRQFLLELGKGFAFVGSPYPIEVNGDAFEIDMLFYHLKLRAYIIVDLKIGKFSPDDAGQMNFYLSAVDSQLRHPDDGPSIGLILCKSKNEVVAEYALRDMNKPIGIATHLTREIEEALPEEFQYSLPTVEEIEAELATNAPEERPEEDPDSA